MELKDLFIKETGFSPVIATVPEFSYSKEYTEWLEKRVLLTEINSLPTPINYKDMSFKYILINKIRYYGLTEAAVDFSIEEFYRHNKEISKNAWQPIEELPTYQTLRILIKFEEQCVLGGNQICSGRWHHLMKHVQADHDDYLDFKPTHFIRLNPN